jgi:hypothetical protein
MGRTLASKSCVREERSFKVLVSMGIKQHGLTKRARIVFVVLLAASFRLIWSAAGLCISQQVPDKVEFAGQGMSLAERVGIDDGAAFVVHFGGDIHGNLDSCG